MAFDKTTRNRLATFVGKARDLIADEFTQQFQGLYGISENGTITPLDKLGHLDDIGKATASLLRERIDYFIKTHPDERDGEKAAVTRLAREQAFTILNRLAAIRMAEKRDLIVESVGKGYQSKGFKVFEQVAGAGLGVTYHRYRRYIFCLFDELAVDLGILFDRRSPQGLLFPRETALQELFTLLNASDLDPLWVEDETIGWIYQYYNDPAERKKMRDESAAPRNSRELAVRNQFFTPRYVVEFLTDNTLGRIWYEMTQGKTRLKEQCRYLVRRPIEIFLKPGEAVPAFATKDDLSQEELLKQPVYIPFRLMKDPRLLLMLDPACGSMHFGLYAFDLYEAIYEEAWDLNVESLRHDYPDKETLLIEVPRLIIEHNIHGIDIDPRAVQIAGLSLWLRAQKSWQAQRVRADKRPRIMRSNIVCAEPMPGSVEMLKEFIATLHPPLLSQLVEKVFVQMQLAGEAGSLLKIEEDIAHFVAEAKKLWSLTRKAEQTKFDLGMADKPNQGELPLDVSGISDESFWETAEERIYNALKDFAEQADSAGYQHRLFAEDAVRGFAFIDLCRKRYDVGVMNPPFGLGSKASEKYLNERYVGSGALEVCASFYSRVVELLRDGSFFGAISSRTFYYLHSLKEWRCKEGFAKSTLCYWIDLGQGILDDAMNETAAYVVSKGRIKEHLSSFGMFHRNHDKETAVSAFVSNGNDTFLRLLTDFEKLPDKPLCYWVSNSFFQHLPSLKAFGDVFADVQMGLAPRDEFRFSRLWWEVESNQIGRDRNWLPYSKGGELSPYYSDVELLLRAKNDLTEIKAALNKKYPYLKGNLSWVLHPENSYFEPGLTFGQRTTFLRVSILPAGCYFSVAGKGIFGRSLSNKAILQLMNTPTAQYLISLRRESWEMNPQYQEGDVARMPWPDIPMASLQALEQTGLESAEKVRRIATFDEIDHSFMCLTNAEEIEDARAQAQIVIELNEKRADLSFSSYLGLDEQDRNFIDQEIIPRWHSRSAANWYAPSDKDRIQYMTGLAYGRWDIRFASGERQSPKLTDLFATLPVCSPGMLQNTHGLPAEPKDVPADYPLRISWHGILVDSENHPEDIVTRIEDVLKVIWKDRWEAIEQETCELLGVKTLRDYFRRPPGFFADHLKRYSKSRRQAPIYWPLSTASGSYTLWIYYHRLTDQTLHTALADFVDPKLKSVRTEISSLRESGNHRDRLEELLDLEKELADFRAEIERIIKLPWKPNLNDGVIITASPLWKLFRLPKWQKDLKACWEKLEKGEYDWAHLAYSIWPKRVEEVCKKDRSIAIAHNLEHLCESVPNKEKTKRRKKENRNES